jgi:nucleotide-binding universal stress UspA family protein
MKRQGIQSLRTRALEHRILVPVNFADASIQAVEYAAKLARPLGATITLLHVVDVNDFKSNRLGFRDQLLKEAREAAEHKLQNFVKLFVGNGVVAEIVVGVGKPVEQILYEIREMNPDMIVMTTRYRKDTRWFWQRDTTTEILKRASCPVSVMHDSGSDLTDLLFY